MYASPILLPQMTNRESFTLTVSVFDDDTGDPVALTDTNGNPQVSIQFEIRRPRPVGARGYAEGYSSSYYDYGSYGASPILTASIGSGISIVDTNVFQVYFSETQFRALAPTTWNVGCTLASLDGIDTRQIFRAKLPILDGWVTN